MQPKIEEALDRLKYIKYHPYKFENVRVSIMICYMKLTVEFCAELVNLSATGVQDNLPDVLMNYIALMTISEIDEVYYNTIKSVLKDQLEENEFELPI